jgi:hypothetical protein
MQEGSERDLTPVRPTALTSWAVVNDKPRAMSDPHAHSTGHAADELDLDGPQTPMWLPLLGGLLFLGAAIFAVTSGGDEPAKVSAEEAGAAAPAPAPEPAQAPGAAPGRPDPIRVQRVPEGAVERVPVQPGGMQPPPGGLQPSPRPALPPGTAAPRKLPPSIAPGGAAPPVRRTPSPAVDEHGHAPH